MPTENRSSNTEQMVSVPVSALKKIHRDLDACQKVIWLRGGFDPAYCKDAQDSLKEIDTLLAQPAVQHQVEPILIQAVAITREDDEDGLRLEWLLEGGISEMEFAGMVLFALPTANDLCEEDGSAEIYLHPPTSDGYSAGDMADQGAKAFRDGQSASINRPDLIEAMAKAIYEQWHGQPGFVEWMPGGNSDKQADARAIARRVIAESNPA